jgi:hypothetical protein
MYYLCGEIFLLQLQLSLSDDEGRRVSRITGTLIPDHITEKTAKLIVTVVRTANLSQKIFVLLFSIMSPTLDSWDLRILRLRLHTCCIFPTVWYSKYNRKYRETDRYTHNRRKSIIHGPRWVGSYLPPRMRRKLISFKKNWINTRWRIKPSNRAVLNIFPTISTAGGCAVA